MLKEYRFGKGSMVRVDRGRNMLVIRSSIAYHAYLKPRLVVEDAFS